MAEQVSFGRRVQTPAERRPALAPAPRSQDDALGARAEAFRASLAEEPEASPASFNDWLREQQARRALAWLVTFAMLTPGALCFVFKAPFIVSAGFEIGGALLNMWLRRERRKHLTEIAKWDMP